MFSSPKQLPYPYAKVPNDNEEDRDHVPKTGAWKPLQQAFKSRWAHHIKLGAYAVLLLLMGFFLGYAFEQRHLGTRSHLELSVQPRLFKMERVFGDKPSRESSSAWDTLMPKRGGFFNHPKIAPKRSAYAVFHQLHCLNALREAYWTTLDAAVSPTALNVNDIPFEVSPVHMRHCIDLLRQALMCTPDLTVETKNETLGGVTGFGTVHQCKDWSELMGWMVQWQDVGAPKRGGEGGNTHAHHHGS
ncbi:hypothetical protein HBI56_224370 [Parastagonospora nodorum]|nr:hypothetical protein HBH53_229910 [Parastagonospora nodorum]KAH3967452.1 hypothetical protein HBH52_187670 [Parastagonospora nodorum]KAH3994069.1 hypothetical protein HBI10_193250 [Parastagonospora nodorum]KAH4008578.1 hypothetical protein HBI13_232660 [Parastagonospora nodorum]KAH4013420.1 hypothetical protein HBI09_218150 [Parastagonospora nodorum]